MYVHQLRIWQSRQQYLVRFPQYHGGWWLFCYGGTNKLEQPIGGPWNGIHNTLTDRDTKMKMCWDTMIDWDSKNPIANLNLSKNAKENNGWRLEVQGRLAECLQHIVWHEWIHSIWKSVSNMPTTEEDMTFDPNSDQFSLEFDSHYCFVRFHFGITSTQPCLLSNRLWSRTKTFLGKIRSITGIPKPKLSLHFVRISKKWTATILLEKTSMTKKNKSRYH